MAPVTDTQDPTLLQLDEEFRLLEQQIRAAFHPDREKRVDRTARLLEYHSMLVEAQEKYRLSRAA